MEERLAEFAALLRENGLRVSMSEHLDAARALALAGLAEREIVKNTLRASLVKRSVDIQVFDELFDLYFSGAGAVVRGVETAMREDFGLSGADFQQVVEQLRELAREWGMEFSELARALLEADSGRLERLLREAGAAVQVGRIEKPFQEGRYTHSIAQALGLAALQRELDAFQERLRDSDLDPGRKELLRRFVERRFRDLTEMVQRYVRAELAKRRRGSEDDLRIQNLAEKSFYYLSEDEIRRMREAVTKLAQRLKNVVAIRRRRGKRGRFDLKATLRRNLQHGGVPFHIEFDRRVREKPQVMVLCDVSDSVRNVSRFMLQFVYSLQDLYSRVRSFIFVSDLGEVTRLFEENEIQRAIDLALSGAVVNVFAHSDFGRAFRIFHRDYLGAVNKKTSVIILGDARNNYNQPHEWVLRDIRQRAKQLIWLNPENRLTWGFGDSEMDRYGPYCDLVHECRNLNQLYRVIDRLVA